jgi:hypothetical protein
MAWLLDPAIPRALTVAQLSRLAAVQQSQPSHPRTTRFAVKDTEMIGLAIK